MDLEQYGGLIYIMASRHCGKIYVGSTANLPQRVIQHRQGPASDFYTRYKIHNLFWAERGATIQDCIAHEKRLKRWRREWKFALIKQNIPDWVDLFDQLV